VSAELFDPVPGFDPKGDLRHARREVGPAELAALIDTARASTWTFRGRTGPDRAMMYLVAFATGYRVKELAKLTPGSFDLESDRPAASLPSRGTKNKKRAVQYLPPGLATQLRDYLAGRPAGSPLWPGGWAIKGAMMLRADLKAAGIPYRVETPDGPRFADFHALRHSYLSALASAGVGVKELQELARHSDPRLTLGIYTHARAGALVDAVSRLQLPGAASANPLAALSRAELERAVVELLTMVATLTGWVAPSVAPAMETEGDNPGHPGTGRKPGRRSG
jgi:integrase